MVLALLTKTNPQITISWALTREKRISCRLRRAKTKVIARRKRQLIRYKNQSAKPDSLINHYCLHEETFHLWLFKICPVTILIRLRKFPGRSGYVSDVPDYLYTRLLLQDQQIFCLYCIRKQSHKEIKYTFTLNSVPSRWRINWN